MVRCWVDDSTFKLGCPLIAINIGCIGDPASEILEELESSRFLLLHYSFTLENKITVQIINIFSSHKDQTCQGILIKS